MHRPNPAPGKASTDGDGTGAGLGLLKSSRRRELTWAVPFLFIALVVLALLRPPPRFPAPTHYRTVVDSSGVAVHIALPFKGAALMPVGVHLDEYLYGTRAPETLVLVGDANDRAWQRTHINTTIDWIYPQVLDEDRLWDESAISYGGGPNPEVESLLAFHPGAYLASGATGGAALLRRVGLPVLAEEGPRPHNHRPHDWDDRCFMVLRVETAMLGHPERAEPIIAEYQREFSDLADDLQPAALGTRPRVLIIGVPKRGKTRLNVWSAKNEYNLYVERAGMINAADRYENRFPDVERVLAMDPDIVFNLGFSGSMSEFLADPMWRGMRAVRNRRVYQMPGLGPGYGGLQFQPIWTRWMAEIAHPDRLKPEVRQMLRDSFWREFRYRVSEDQIDAILHLDENKDAPGYARFARDYHGLDGAGSN